LHGEGEYRIADRLQPADGKLYPGSTKLNISLTQIKKLEIHAFVSLHRLLPRNGKMKTLYIVRHAKSSWKYPELTDEERPLLEKGKKRTRKVIDYLLDKNTKVDLIISSHAVRAMETARILAHALGYPEDNILISRQVYHANAEQLYDQFFDLSDEVEDLMIVGHNPAFTNFANHFLDKKIDWLPTSGIVSVSFNTRLWVNINMAERSTNFVVYPREL
jgi:phosphohistidine phosphatase